MSTIHGTGLHSTEIHDILLCILPYANVIKNCIQRQMIVSKYKSEFHNLSISQTKLQWFKFPLRVQHDVSPREFHQLIVDKQRDSFPNNMVSSRFTTQQHCVYPTRSYQNAFTTYPYLNLITIIESPTDTVQTNPRSTLTTLTFQTVHGFPKRMAYISHCFPIIAYLYVSYIISSLRINLTIFR